jgi:uncharacterized protein YqeY
MITKINDELKQAMRDKNTIKLNVLRSLKTAIMNASLQKGNVNEILTDTEIIGIIRKQVSQRQDSVAQFVNAQRHDLIAVEEAEMEVLKDFLPTELTEFELEALVENYIIVNNATSKKDMGKVIKDVVLAANGRADNKRISTMIGGRLS